MSEDLIFRLRERAKSVQEGKPDRLGALLVEAADQIETMTRCWRIAKIFGSYAIGTVVSFLIAVGLLELIRVIGEGFAQ